MNLNQLIQLGLYEEAINECKAIINDADLDDDNQGKLTGLVYLGIIYTKQGLYHKSKDIFDTNYEDILSECRFYWNGKELADTYLYYKEYDKIENYITSYLDQNPDDIKAFLIKGHIFFHKKMFEQALQVFHQANKLSSGNAQILYGAGLCCVQLEKWQSALKYFEQAFDLGYQKAIEEIFKIIFTREGCCDYINCTDTCCKNVMLKGIDGKTIQNNANFELLLQNDERNTCWNKDRSNSKGDWIFECKNLGENNYCNNYEMRPDTCRDYPSSILTTRSACSYSFILNNNLPKFNSSKTLNVVLHILREYQYISEMNHLIKLNKDLLY